jgi:RNA polymerase sigma-70 factor (ECF subfamily)
VIDRLQDVFVSALEQLATLREEAAFGGWLAQIARHRALDHLRKKSPVLGAVPDVGADDPPRGEAEEALQAIRELPEAYRETLVLRLVEGMTGPEIAERTGLTPESVRVNLHRGMKMLREKLGGGPQ